MGQELIAKRVEQIRLVLQLVALIQPALAALFQLAENMMPTGKGSEKLEFVKAAIHKLIDGMPGLADRFEELWSIVGPLVSLFVDVAKKFGAVTPSPAKPADTPSPAAPAQ